jgi:8-oxo-dGTP pyrophosphatase MutT (NUDIX family)
MWDQLHLKPDHPEPDERPMAAVLAPLFEDDEGVVRVVLTKRPDTMPTHAGHIAFPGGRPDPEDDGPVGTALREAHEEVGITSDQVDVLGFLPAIDTVEYSLLVVPVVARISTPLGLVPSEREVARIHTPRLADLADPGNWWHVPWNEWKVWYYDLDGDTLWGATARMVRYLVGLDPYETEG